LTRAKVEEAVAGYLFVMPSFFILFLFLFVPILSALVLVFLKYDLLTPPRWAGLANIRALFTDRRMVTCYWNTLRFMLGATLLNNVLGLVLAMGVNRAMPRLLKYVLRTALFFPVLTTTASLAVVWSFILTRDRGVLNYYLQQVGLQPVAWLASARWALTSTILYDVWKSCGYLMVLYLAGLQGIPGSLYEAAEIDGASRWQLTTRITLPLITPTAFFCIVVSLIGSSQVFDNVFVLTGGGPGDASRLIAIYIYELGFKRFDMGYAAVVSLTLLLALLLLTLLQFWGARKWVHYE
jgi:multiple sugar transport system permease protein